MNEATWEDRQDWQDYQVWLTEQAAVREQQWLDYTAPTDDDTLRLEAQGAADSLRWHMTEGAK